MATSYAFALQELLQKLQQSLGGLDDETQQVETATQRGLYDARLEKDRSIQTTNEAAADRGMVSSGINIAEGATVRSKYDELMGRLEGDRSNALSSIARKRIAANTGYTQGKTDVERQQYESEQAEAALQRAKEAEAQVELAKTNPEAAGITPGTTHETPEAYAAAAKAYQEAEYRNSVQAYMDAVARNNAPAAPASTRAPSRSNSSTKAPLRPIRGAY